MVNVMLYSNFSEFNEICRALGLKDVTITKLQNAKKLQLLDTPLKNGSVAYVEAKKMLSDINIPKRAYIFVREEDSYEYKFSAIIVKNHLLYSGHYMNSWREPKSYIANQ